MGDATVNGDKPQSTFLTVSSILITSFTEIESFIGWLLPLQHLTSYPIVSDSIATFKANPYGAKSIDLTNAGYVKFVKPTFPYFETPASYAKPYVVRVDEIGDKFLSKFDEKVPIVKSETKEIQTTIVSYINWPLSKATETKDWALSTYSNEYKKCGGDGIVAGGKAAVTTSLVISSDVLKWMSSFLQAKKEESKEFIQEKTQKWAWRRQQVQSELFLQVLQNL